MLIILGLYFGLVWLVFSRLQLLPWNAVWKGVVYTAALMIAVVVIGALNHTTPSGSVSAQGVVTSVTPNVAGIVTKVAVRRHQIVSRGDVLFRLDGAPQEAEVARLEAALGSSTAAADQLRSDHAAAEAEIEVVPEI